MSSARPAMRTGRPVRQCKMTAVSGVFACETARSQRVDVGGLELHCLEWGAPAASGVLLLHGGAAHAHWFDAVATRLADGRHVVALDQRGHGESAWARPPAYATEDFARDIVAVVERFGWRSVVLVGHSMGGHNAIACAAWHPDRIRGLAIVDSRPAIPAERLAQMKERGARPPRRHPTLEAAVAAFRLLPPETAADPALLAHLARAGVAWRDGAVSTRFDPACYAARRPRGRLAAPRPDRRADAGRPRGAKPDPPPTDGRAARRGAACGSAGRDPGRVPPSRAGSAGGLRRRARSIPRRSRRRDGRHGSRRGRPAGRGVTVRRS